MKRILLLAFVIVSLLGQAQENISEMSLKPVHELGLATGFTTGSGFSYRYFPGKFGYQITLIPPLLNDGRLDYFNGGFSLLMNIKEVKEGRFFAYASGSYRAKYEYFYNYYGSNQTYIDEQINAGVGIGFDIYAGKYLGINLMGGYGLKEITEGVNTFFTVETGIYFKFPRKG